MRLELSDLEAATKFQKSRLGRVFKSGEHGLGYYRDRGTPILLDALIPDSRRPVISISLAQEILGNEVSREESPDHQDDTPPVTCPEGDAVRQVMKHRRRLIQTDQGWAPSEGSVALADDSHIGRGWYAIETANCNCWNGAMEHLLNTAADAVCIQEATKTAGQDL